MISKKAGLLMNAIRLERNVNLGEAAELMGMSKGMLARIENGKAKVTLETLEAFCTTYNFSKGSFVMKLDEVTLLDKAVGKE